MQNAIAPATPQAPTCPAWCQLTHDAPNGRDGWDLIQHTTAGDYGVKTCHALIADLPTAEGSGFHVLVERFAYFEGDAGKVYDAALRINSEEVSLDEAQILADAVLAAVDRARNAA